MQVRVCDHVFVSYLLLLVISAQLSRKFWLHSCVYVYDTRTQSHRQKQGHGEGGSPYTIWGARGLREKKKKEEKKKKKRKKKKKKRRKKRKAFTFESLISLRKGGLLTESDSNEVFKPLCLSAQIGADIVTC